MSNNPQSSYLDLPDDLPIPQDDGAADHLQGKKLDSIILSATNGAKIDLSKLSGTTVVFIYPYVPAIPKKHRPSNPASSILPNPQLDEEAAKAVLKDKRDQEHKAAAAQAKALHAKAKAVNKEPRTRWEWTPHVGPWGQWYAPARRSSSTSLGCCCCLAC